MNIYDLPNECISIIMAFVNYKTTLILLRTSKIFYTKNIWKQKCEYQYPKKKYFDFWTEKVNFLVQSKEYFSFAINFLGYVEPYIYESNTMIKDMLRLVEEDIDYKAGKGIYTIIDFKVENQFLLVRNYCDKYDHEENYHPAVISQHDNYEEALAMIKKDQIITQQHILKLEYFNFDGGYYDYKFTYVIINLKDTIPFFVKLGKSKHHEVQEERYYIKPNIGNFYRGDYKNLIKIDI